MTLFPKYDPTIQASICQIDYMYDFISILKLNTIISLLLNQWSTTLAGKYI